MRALLLLALLASPADAHCYSIWHFKNAQRCGGSNRPPVVMSIAKRMTVPAERSVVVPPSPGPSFDIPLTDPDPAMMALKAQLQ